VTDLRDIRGRLIRFGIAVLIAAPLGIGVMLALASIITSEETGAADWFAVSIPVIVFIPATMVINALLARFGRFQARSNLPVARLVRR
jgi:hypothetical protein